MRNLAGVTDCDKAIREELETAGIHVCEGIHDRPSEVPYSITGAYGPIRFTRGWSYWVATGPVELPLAKMLYALDEDRVIRVAGYAGGAEPVEPWVEWMLPDGRKVVGMEHRAEIQRLRALFTNPAACDWVFCDDPKSIGARQVVDTYHIDTQEGLNTFAAIISLTA